MADLFKNKTKSSILHRTWIQSVSSTISECLEQLNELAVVF